MASMMDEHRMANKMKLVKYAFSTIFNHWVPM